MPASRRQFPTYRRFDSIFLRRRKTAPAAHFTQYPRAFLDLAALSEACGGTEWQIHAYHLMRDHFQLIGKQRGPKRRV